MAWVPYRMQIKSQIIKFWHRLHSMSNSRIPSLILRWSQQLSANNWATRTALMFNDLSITHSSQEQFLDEACMAVTSGTGTPGLEATIHDPPRNSESGGRFAFYREYKPEPLTELYIKLSISRNSRRIITMLRCGCLPLAIETGRYRNSKVPLSQRLCLFCNTGPEDESHFLDTCTILSELRMKLYNVVSDLLGEGFYTLTLKEKTIHILQLCATNVNVGKLIVDMYSLRCRSLS